MKNLSENPLEREIWEEEEEIQKEVTREMSPKEREVYLNYLSSWYLNRMPNRTEILYEVMK